MEYRKLEYFLKVCETGSISSAAAKLYISQQAVSKSIESLEREVGLALFYRTPQGLTLTRCGQTLRDEGLALLRHHGEVMAKLTALRTEYTQTLVLAFFSGMLTQFPQGFFEDFIARHPDTRFRFYSYLDTEYGRKYMNLDADLIFTTTPLNRQDIALVYQCHRPFYVLLSPDNALAGRPRIDLKDLKDQFVISINSDFGARDRIHLALEAAGVQVQSVLSDAEQQFSYALARTQGAAVFFAGPACMVPEGLVRCPLAAEDLNWDFYIYRRKGALPSPAQALIQEIQAFRALQ